MLPKASIPVAAPMPVRRTSFTDGDDRADYESGDLVVRAASAPLVGGADEPSGSLGQAARPTNRIRCFRHRHPPDAPSVTQRTSRVVLGYFSSRDRYSLVWRRFELLLLQMGPCMEAAQRRFQPLGAFPISEDTPRRSRPGVRSCFRWSDSLALWRWRFARM